MRVHANITGPRGASLAATEGDLAIRRAPSGNIVVMVNRRPDSWSGEWPGNVLTLFLKPDQARKLGQLLDIAGAAPERMMEEPYPKEVNA